MFHCLHFISIDTFSEFEYYSYIYNFNHKLIVLSFSFNAA